MSQSPHQKKKTQDALRDKSLQTALTRSVSSYKHSREKSLAGFDLAKAQDEVRAIKERCIEQMDDLFARFKAEAEGIGAVVHEAANAQEAGEIVLKLAQERGVKLIAKAKSMLTEEIELNHTLEAAGLQVVETDLGEWIIQLAGEKPSHFTCPAIHKTREQIAELFEKATGEKVDSDPESLAAFARERLRQVFVDADMGISGANIAIADTGTLVLVSNEGNARLVTTLPPIHVAIVGYEKLVENLRDAVSILEVLPRSATGQKITSYVSMITGPSRTADVEKVLTLGMHGPKELHIVFVDNGRKAMREDEKFREALYCIRCGACLNLCPVYRSIGGHAFANVYMGGIGAVSSVYYGSLDAAEDTAALCTGCSNCVSICPTKIDVPGMMLEVRSRLVEKNGIPVAGKLALSALKNPRVFGTLIRMARAFQGPAIGEDGLVKDLPLISGKFGSRKMPGFAKRFLRDTPLTRRPQAASFSAAKGPALSRAGERGKDGVAPSDVRVSLYAGCVIDFIYPHIGEAIWRVIGGSGAEMIYPKSQACCGAPAMYVGDEESALELCVENLEALEEGDPTHIVTGCPTCAVMLKEHYRKILEGTELEERAKAMAAKVYDFAGLVEALGIELEAGAGGTATYHDPCHQVRGTRTSAASRKLLAECGMDTVEMTDCDECCGFAGSYSLKQSEISDAILSRKLDHAIATGADCVVTDCPGCIMQIGGGLAKRGCKTPVRHSAEIAADSIGGE